MIAGMPGWFHGLGRNVVALGAASFFTDVASEMVFPLLPIFLTGALGATAAWLGVMEGAANGLSSVLRIVSGRVADRLGARKPLVLLGYGLSVVARPIFALATAGWHVLAIRLLDRVGKGIRLAPRDALIAASCAPELRGRAFGLQKAMDYLGASIGPLVGALLLSSGWSIREVFVATAVPAALVLAVVGLLVRDVAPAAPEERGAAPSAALGAPLRRLTALWALFTLGAASDAFLILQALRCGIAEPQVPLFWCGVNVVRSLLALPGGMLADRFGRRGLLLAGWTLHAGVFAALAFTEGVAVFLALTVLHALPAATGESAARAWVADVAPRELRATAYGAFHLAAGLAALAGSAGFGFLWAGAGAPSAFLAASACSLAAAIGLAVRGVDGASKP
jgi:MFS family permease